MAIYHLSAKIHRRSSGKSIVAAAAYRAGQSLWEEQTGISHDYTRKEGVEHSEILAPDGAPEWVFDRSALWNAVESVEKRRDAQLAREVEVGLPVELEDAEQVELLRDYVRREFVVRGMVADIAIHRDNPDNPHAHVLLSMRTLTKEGFGPKERSWNERQKLMAWRQAWEELTNEHLARAGLAVRIDHRTLKQQGLELEPGRKIGVSRERQLGGELPHRILDRVTEQREIARENGQRIIDDPALALKALTHSQATFTHRDIAKYLNTRTEGAEQFQAAYLKVTTARELVSLGLDDRDAERFTSREMLALESDLLGRAEQLNERQGHQVGTSRVRAVRSQHSLGKEQERAFQELVATGDLKTLVGVAGSGKSRLLAAAREAWEAEGFRVKGAALSGIAAENLTMASGIQSRTLASFEYSWNQDREPLTSKDVLVIDEAGMVGTRQLQRVLEIAEKARAKVVLVGDPEQLQAIEAGAPFRGIVSRHGMAQLNEVQRQHFSWQREATQELARGQTASALGRHEKQGGLIQVTTREAARTALLARWTKDGESRPKESRLMLAYTRDDVKELNASARALRQQRRELGREETMDTSRGARAFAVNDRIHFLRNEKSLGVKNGSLGTIEAIQDNIVQVRVDGRQQRVAVDTRFYHDLDYGYAATVYKAQGTTVDRAYVLATPHYDRHAAYVALSRHRESVTVYYAVSDFGAAPESPERQKLARDRMLLTLSRAQHKELVHDYLEMNAEASLPKESRGVRLAVDDTRRQAREAWLAMRARQKRGAPEQDPREQAIAAWRELREKGTRPIQPARTPDREQELKQEREGPELDL
jgi:Ti-type conjugative transfer relaxase TraA